MIRYPVFSFDGDDIFVFESPRDVRVNLEVYQVDYPEVLLDSDGRLLTKKRKRDHVELSDSGEEPDSERLRSHLLHALRKRGQDWTDDAPVESLITTAMETWDQNVGVAGLAEAVARILRFLRIRRPKP